MPPFDLWKSENFLLPVLHWGIYDNCLCFFTDFASSAIVSFVEEAAGECFPPSGFGYIPSSSGMILKCQIGTVKLGANSVLRTLKLIQQRYRYYQSAVWVTPLRLYIKKKSNHYKKVCIICLVMRKEHDINATGHHLPFTDEGEQGARYLGWTRHETWCTGMSPDAMREYFQIFTVPSYSEEAR